MTKGLTIFCEIQTIEHRFFEGERALFARNRLQLSEVKFYPGESALKHTTHIEARHCEFMGKYPFWHNDHSVIEHCVFTVYARTAIWYTQNLRMTNTLVEAPKMFREVRHLTVEKSRFTSAAECFWNCHGVRLRQVEMKGADYVFMNSTDVEVSDFKLQGNYSFQGAKNVVIRNSVLDSKDAFWNSENVTVYDSVIDGEYLGWHSKNLRLVNCTISGPQPLCYATDLVLENCTMAGANPSFEYSTVQADVLGEIVSVKNPRGGFIRADRIGEIVLDENCLDAGDCVISTNVVG